MKTKVFLIGVAALVLAAVTINAQTISAASVQALLKDGVITYGQPFDVKGQSFVVTTNETGGLNIVSSGPAGSLSVNTPTSASGALAKAEQYVSENNPANKIYYGTNELVARVGACYLQNSGQTVAEIGIEKYGLFKSLPQLGLGGALFQGNDQGKSGTAGACGFIDYRRIIGDVSAQVGVGVGYDNWNASPMGVLKCDVEYRQNAHLGEFVGIGYAIEPSGVSGDRGLLIRGGINYAF